MSEVLRIVVPGYSVPPLIQCVELASRRASIEAQKQLKRGLWSLASIAASAPFVGWLGTTIAILASFKSIGTSRSAALAAVTGGVSEAMIPSLLGLFFALIAFWCYRYLCEQLDGFELEMESATVDLVNRLVVHLGRLRITDPAAWADLTTRPMVSANPIHCSIDHAPSEPRFNLQRMYRHGVLELAWPRPASLFDAQLTLDAALWVCLGYGVAGFVNYSTEHRSFVAAIILALFIVAGRAFKRGSVEAMLTVFVFLAFTSVTGILSYGMDRNGLCCLAAMFPLVGIVRASRWTASTLGVGSRGVTLQRMLLWVLVVSASVAVLFGSVFGIYATPSNESSMHPTIDALDWLVGVTPTMAGAIHRSELVEVKWGETGGVGTVRVIGFPGDRVQITAGRLMLNGVVIQEPYCNPYPDAKGDFPMPSEAYADESLRLSHERVYKAGMNRETAYTVPARHYFVLNDNRSQLSDSRTMGPMTRECVVGKVILVFGTHPGSWGIPRMR